MSTRAYTIGIGTLLPDETDVLASAGRLNTLIVKTFAIRGTTTGEAIGVIGLQSLQVWTLVTELRSSSAKPLHVNLNLAVSPDVSLFVYAWGGAAFTYVVTGTVLDYGPGLGFEGRGHSAGQLPAPGTT